MGRICKMPQLTGLNPEPAVRQQCEPRHHRGMFTVFIVHTGVIFFFILWKHNFWYKRTKLPRRVNMDSMLEKKGFKFSVICELKYDLFHRRDLRFGDKMRTEGAWTQTKSMCYSNKAYKLRQTSNSWLTETTCCSTACCLGSVYLQCVWAAVLLALFLITFTQWMCRDY